MAAAFLTHPGQPHLRLNVLQHLPIPKNHPCQGLPQSCPSSNPKGAPTTPAHLGILVSQLKQLGAEVRAVLGRDGFVTSASSHTAGTQTTHPCPQQSHLSQGCAQDDPVCPEDQSKESSWNAEIQGQLGQSASHSRKCPPAILPGHRAPSGPPCTLTGSQLCRLFVLNPAAWNLLD